MAMYKSLLAAEKTKTRMQALMMAGRTGMPLAMMATTKGDAEAPVVAFLVANMRPLLSYGTSVPMRKTDST